MLSGIQRYIMSGGRLGSQTYNICRPGYFQLTNIIRTFVEYNKYYQPQKSNGRTIWLFSSTFHIRNVRCRKLPASLDLPATDSFKTRPCKQSFSANYESKPYKGHKRKMWLFLFERKGALRQRIHVHNKCTHSARGKHVPLSDDRISRDVKTTTWNAVANWRSLPPSSNGL